MMPKIPQYTSQIEPQGGLAVQQAQPADFGFEQGLSDIGKGMQGSAAILHEREVQQDVTNVRVDRAKAQAEWDQKFLDYTKNAPLGDPTIREKFMEAFNADAQNRRSVAQTTKGQQVFDETHATLMQHFSHRAGQFQATSAGLKAKQDYATEIQSYGATISSAQTVEDLKLKYDLAMEMARRTILSEDGTYARAGRAVQEDLFNDAKREFTTQFMTAMVDIDPQKTLDALIKGEVDSVIDLKVKLPLIHRARENIRTNENRENEDVSRVEVDRAIGKASAKRDFSIPGKTGAVPAPASSKFTPDDQNAFSNAAQVLGLTVPELYGIAHLETGGTFNPQILGGKNQDGSGAGTFFGLFQFSKENQKKYGIGPGSTVKEQLNALVRYASDAGYKPGMGVDRLYGVIQAFGSINRPFSDPTFRDANAHITEHVARIKGFADAFAKATGSGVEMTTGTDVRSILVDARTEVANSINSRYGSDPARARRLIEMAHSKLDTWERQEERAVLGRQRENYQTIVADIRGENKTTPTSYEELSPAAKQAYTKLDFTSQNAIDRLLQQNSDALIGKPARTNQIVEQETFLEMAQGLITTEAQLLAKVPLGLNNIASYERLRAFLYAPPGGRQLETRIRQHVRAGWDLMDNGMEGNILAKFQPRQLENAREAYDADVRARIESAGKDVNKINEMLTAGNPNYIGNPTYVRSFLPKAAQAISDVAAAAQAQRPVPGVTSNQVTGQIRPAQQGAQANPQPITATNPTTGKKAISNDGGRTWRMLP